MAALSCSTLARSAARPVDLAFDRLADTGGRTHSPKHTTHMPWRYTLLAGNLAEIRNSATLPSEQCDFQARLGVQIDASDGTGQIYSKWNRVVKEIIPSQLTDKSQTPTAQAVKTLRKALRYSQKQLADAIDVSQSNVAKWETGFLIPPGQICVKLSKLAPEEDRAWWMAQAGVTIEKKQDGDESRVRRIPLLRDATAAGTPRAVDEREIEEMVVFPRRWVPSGGTLYAIRVEGDSMSPLLEEGYVAIVNVARTEIGGLVDRMVLARDEEGGVTVKWLRKQGTLYLLVPQNTSPRHPIRVLQSKNDGAILGEIVRWVGEPPQPRKRKT